MAKRLLRKLWKIFVDWRTREADIQYISTLSDHELQELRLDQKTIRGMRCFRKSGVWNPRRNMFH